LLVRQDNIDGAPRLRRSSGELDPPVVPRGSTQAKDQLLDAEVAGIHRLAEGVPAEVDAKRHLQGNSDALPGIHGQPSPQAALEAADRHSSESRTFAQTPLCQSAPTARDPDSATEPCELLLIEPARFELEVGAPTAWHDRDMFNCRTYRRLT
jgi:hypothetical protein